MTQYSALNPRERILMGPGPSTVPARVLRALGAPTLGHLDPQYIGYMDEACQMMRDVFQTESAKQLLGALEEADPNEWWKRVCGLW